MRDLSIDRYWCLVIPGSSAPEIIQRFTAEVQPKIDAVRESQLSEDICLLPFKLIFSLENMPAQNVSPETIRSLATSISEAAQSADVQLKALKGQPADMVLGVHASGDMDVTKSMSDFINDAKESTTVSTPIFFTSSG